MNQIEELKRQDELKSSEPIKYGKRNKLLLKILIQFTKTMVGLVIILAITKELFFQESDLGKYLGWSGFIMFIGGIIVGGSMFGNKTLNPSLSHPTTNTLNPNVNLEKFYREEPTSRKMQFLTGFRWIDWYIIYGLLLAIFANRVF